MMIKQIFIYFLFVFLLAQLFSCAKENHLTDPIVSITSISPMEAKQGDTLTLTIEYKDCLPSEELEIFVDDAPAKIIDKDDWKKIKIKVPDAFSRGLVTPFLPNVFCASNTFEKINNFTITHASPTNGTVGTEVTIKGFDFLIGFNTKFAINNSLCEIVSISDTVAVIKIPEGCGTGKIKGSASIQDNLCIGYGCTGPLFTYNFNTKRQLLMRIDYLTSTNSAFYERDNLGKVTRINFSNGYLTFRYGNDGLLDTVSSYSGEKFQFYTIYTRENSGNKITASKIYPNSFYKENYEYFYENGILVTKKEYTNADDVFTDPYLFMVTEFEYKGNERKVTITTYDKNGNPNSNGHSESTWVDIYNNVLNRGIPGYPNEIDYNESYTKYNLIELIYNENGNLEKVFSKKNICENPTPIYKYYYE